MTLPGRIVVVGGGELPSTLVPIAARNALERADRLLTDADVSDRWLVQVPPRARDAWDLVDVGTPRDVAIGQMLRVARQGKQVVWIVCGDPTAQSWSAAMAACEAAGVILTVMPAVRRKPLTCGGPLSGKVVAITRPSHQVASLATLLELRGAEPLLMPTVEIVPAEDQGPLTAAMGEIEHYDYLVFTSANAVGPVFETLRLCGRDARALAGLTLCAVGPGTTHALARHGLRPDVQPTEHTADGLLHALASRPLRDRRALLPRAAHGRQVLPRGLREMGATVDEVVLYSSEMPEASLVRPGLEALRRGKVQALTFTSGSTIRNFIALAGQDWADLVASTIVGVIGPVAREVAQREGMRVDLMAKSYTSAGLVDALAEHFSSS